MVCLGLGQSRHTVVAVPQDLNPPTVILLSCREREREGRHISFHTIDNAVPVTTNLTINREGGREGERERGREGGET